MNIDFQGRGLLFATAPADHARRCLHDALIHRADVIQRIVVRLGGVDWRRRHNGMYCLMQVHMSDGLVATVVDIGPDIYDLVDRATDRVGRLVAEYLGRAPRDRRSTASSANPSLHQQVGASSTAPSAPHEFEPTQPSCTTVHRSARVGAVHAPIQSCAIAKV